MICRVCRTDGVREFQTIDAKRYLRCDNCEATFLDPAHWLTPGAELAHYKHHRNDVDDPCYRRFLSRLAKPLMAHIKPASRLLDYGCGPGPALAAMLGEAGHDVAIYDPYFFPDEAVLRERYDAVMCSEVAEHFHNPADEFDKLGRLVNGGGVIGLMTCFQTEDDRFARWHYRLDPTHVVFYREATLRELARLRGWSFECPAKDVAIMSVPS